MASALHRVDFAIGAAGMSSMERACAGLPSLQLILTANQVANAEWLQLAYTICGIDGKWCLSSDGAASTKSLEIRQRDVEGG